ncbi:MAG: leucine-rich repeat domain-containing protein, partial [Bryobacterales bacterium]|nr:leucine-rich repeat domain-containing protein [Bryobacterales bacterium]
NSAFRLCDNLTDLTIGGSVVSIGSDAFRSTGLTTVAIPNSVREIGSGAFAYSPSLETLVLGNGVETIEEDAFSLTALSRVVLPESITNIAPHAFDFIGSLSNVYFLGNAPTVTDAFANSPAVTLYYMPGRTGWADPFAGYPAKLWNPTLSSMKTDAGIVSCTVTGTLTIPVALETTTNIFRGPWVLLQSTSLTNAAVTLMDLSSTNLSSRFYRISGP